MEPNVLKFLLAYCTNYSGLFFIFTAPEMIKILEKLNIIDKHLKMWALYWLILDTRKYVKFDGTNKYVIESLILVRTIWLHLFQV